jgi:tetratricopeptide (TPR) repeat protein
MLKEVRIKYWYLKLAIVTSEIFILALLETGDIIAQERSLSILGTAEFNMKPLANTKVTLFKNGNVERTFYTGTDGMFHFDLDLNSEYTVVFEKQGYLGKKIAFNTLIPDSVIVKQTLEFAMTLYEGCEGVNTEVLNEPVDRIQFSKNEQEFISDKGYVGKNRSRLEKLLIDVDQCQKDKFQTAKNEGDKLYNTKEFEKAREKYEEALKTYPEDAYAQKKIEDINKKIGENRQVEQKYTAAIKEADLLFAAKNYEVARERYNEAIALKPQNSYPREKIVSIDNLYKAQEQIDKDKLDKEKNYNNLIAQGNAATTLQNYEVAKNFYQQALLIKPNAQFPQQKIEELKPLIALQQQNSLKKEANDKAYTEAMAMAQSALQSNDLNAAKQHFNRALMIKPDANLPKQKMDEIDRNIQQQKEANQKTQKADNEQMIIAALDEGDMYFKQKNYDAAEAAYQRVIQLDPKDTYAQQRIEKIKSLNMVEKTEKQQILEKAYDETLDKGDALIISASYQQAIVAYKQALLQKPDDPIAKSKLVAAEQKLATEQQKEVSAQVRKENEAKTKEQQYTLAVSQADQLFATNKLTEAKTYYQKALLVKPGEPYPAGQITKIDGLIAEQVRKENEAKTKEQQYTLAVSQADQLFATNKLTEAKTYYQKALLVRPGEPYPAGQITKIDGLIAEQVRKENEAKTKEQQYILAVSQADQLFATNKLTEAKTYYQKALLVRPGEPYPAGQITKIDGLIAEQVRKENEAKTKEQQYILAVSQADQLFATNKLTEAKTYYQKALLVRPGEPYPAGQITKIDGLIAEQVRKENEAKTKEQQYILAVSQADQLFAANKLTEAKTYYQKALLVKSGEPYPSGQITKIDAQLIQTEKENKEKLAFEQKYNGLIESADKSFDSHNYSAAKITYTQALNMKSTEAYPRERLNKIAEYDRILAQEDAARKSTTVNTAKAEKNKVAKPLADLKFANDSEREKYLNGLRKEYPVGVTLEVHKEQYKTTNRYVVIRVNEVREFRMVTYSWGGVEYSLNGIPITGQYFDTQVKIRKGEFFQEKEY